MTSRAQYYRAEARHSQRNGVPKGKLQPVGSDTLWLAGWLAEAQGTGPFGADSILALALGADPELRVARLRTASRFGVLRMSHEPGLGYRWQLAPAGQLGPSLPRP